MNRALKTVLISFMGTTFLTAAADLPENPENARYTIESLRNDPRIGDDALASAIENVMPRISYDQDKIMCKCKFSVGGAFYELTDERTGASLVLKALLSGKNPYLLGTLCQSYVGRNAVGARENLFQAVNDRIAEEKRLSAG